MAENSKKKKKILGWVAFAVGTVAVVALTVFWFKAELPTHILVSILGGLAIVCAIKVCYDEHKAYSSSNEHE